MNLQRVHPNAHSDVGCAQTGLNWLQLVDPRQAVLVLIASATILHIVMAGAVGLGNDETYTVSNARILSLSYVDYPPLHVWLVGVWSRLVHSEAAFAVRLPFVLLFSASTWLMYSLTAFLFSSRAAFWAALALNIAPVYALAHGSWVLPDGPLTFLMLASALTIARILFSASEPSRQITAWVFAGALVGLATLTKYHGAFLAAGTFAFLLSWPPGRQVLRAPAPWIAIGVTVLILLPAIVWNEEHNWIGMTFQSARLTKSANISLLRVLLSIAEQAVYLSPWLFIPQCMVLWHGLRSGPALKEAWFLSLLAVGPIVFFTTATLFAKGLPHWSMPGWLFTFPLLGQFIENSLKSHRPGIVAGASAAFVFTLLLSAAFIGQADTGWLTNSLSLGARQADPTLELLSWKEAETAIHNRILIDASTPAIAGSRWMDAAKLNYVMGATVPVLCLCSDPQQFRFLHSPALFIGKNVIVIQTKAEFEKRGITFGRWFHSVKFLFPVTLHRGGRDALELLVFQGIMLKQDTLGSLSRTSARAAQNAVGPQ